MGLGLNDFIFEKINKKQNIKEILKSWELFRSCLLNSTANPAQFLWKWAVLAMPFSRQLLNDSQDFNFSLIISFLFIFFKYETIETQAHAFLTLNILAIGRVWYFAQRPEFSWWFDLLIN